ncbi:alpha,alpha-trehalose-phosphate synthase (UDP-forming) [Halorientalis litorea]|uniref:alpha,alpha-trehalose-phosphate synthase (UDP-forming) n=1 Tax=Halorientalis litorea TaxID=2931977 RepID=UPI001FF64E80|nr:trehalose-6-phosphate synthase [Halorientalis litorea]
MVASTDGDGTDGLVVVSNREPYAHRYAADGIECDRPTGGLVSALDAVVGDLGGTWVAWGSGDADFDPSVVDGDDTVALPPGDPRYTLRRVRLTRRQVDEYYYGYSNQVLWPLCHLDTNYVAVEPGFWSAYEDANAAFADAVADTTGPVWLQDYHLTLVPRALRERGVDRTLVHFWHIPWPPAEVFAICPHAEQVLDGLLAADAVGFHTDGYRENFLDSVERSVPGATVDRAAGTVAYGERETRTYVAPVGVDTDELSSVAGEEGSGDYWRRLARTHGIDDDTAVAVGVDRLDYTKGILERLDALERLWETTPRLRDSLVYVQKASRSREGIDSYRTYHGRVRDRVYELNQRFGTDDWTPVVYLDGDLSRRDLLGLYRNADLCVVSPRRDGMNLVAKEYVAASAGVGGTLVLSEFAGAAESLGAAVTVNPFDTAAFADRLTAAVEMADDERSERFERLLAAVRETGIEAWLTANLRQLQDEGR